MSGTPSPLPGSTAFGVLEQRAGVLGAPLWRFDAEGRLAGAPSGPASLMPLAEWADVSRRIDELARGLAFGVRHRLFEAVPGVWIASLAERVGPERGGTRRGGVVLAMIAGQRIRGAAGAGGLGLDWAAAEPFLRKDKAAVEQTAEVLRWTWQDATREELARRTLDQFSDRLAEAYEEINLLF